MSERMVTISEARFDELRMYERANIARVGMTAEEIDQTIADAEKWRNTYSPADRKQFEADAELGRLVRGMSNPILYRISPNRWANQLQSGGIVAFDTPEEALRAALELQAAP